MKIIRFVALLICSPLAVGQIAKDTFFESCEFGKEKIEMSGSDDLIWRTWDKNISTSSKNAEFWGVNIPVLLPEGSELALSGSYSTERISFHGDNLIQTIEMDGMLTLEINEKSNFSILAGLSVYDALIDSFSYTSDNIDCSKFKDVELKSHEYKEVSRLLSLLLLKSTFVPYKAEGVYRVNGVKGFITLSETILTYHTIHNGVEVRSTVYGVTDSDISQFFYALSHADSQGRFHSKPMDLIMDSWRENTVESWTATLNIMKTLNVSKVTLDSVSEQIDYLTNE
jgi:hypothetical protein